MPRIVFLYIALLACAYTMAQTPTYIHYTVDDGLPSNLVYCALQDKKGIMWFGTDKGLVRFDNREFRTYGVADGLPDPEVFSLVEDSKNRIWISSFRKRLCYIKDGVLINERTDNTLKKVDVDNGIFNIYEDVDSSIWIANSSFNIYNIKNQSVEKISLSSSILQISRMKDKLLALGSGYVFDITDIKHPKLIYDLVKELNEIPKFYGVFVHEDKILYSLSGFLLLLGWDSEKLSVLSKQKFYSGRVNVDQKGRFWLCTSAGGAFCFKNNDFGETEPKDYSIGNKVSYMLEDKHGTFWFCTLGNGLLALPTRPPFQYNLPDKHFGTLNCMVLSKDRYLIVGDDVGNVVSLKKQGFNIAKYTTEERNNRILSIVPEFNKKTWVVSDGGIFTEDSKGIRKKVNIGGSPKCLLPDEDRIWYGTSSRLAALSIKGDDTLVLQHRRVTALGIDAERNVWSGGIEGLYSSKDTFRYNWGEAFPSLRSRIVSIATGEPGYIWVVTPDQGLLRVRVKGGRVTETVPANNLLQRPIKNIQSLYRAENGYLWLATNRGVYGLDPQTWRVQHFNRHNGLSSDDVRSVVVYKDTLWAGTTSGITRLVLPSGADRIAFPTYITEIRYQQGQELINYSVIDSIAPEKEIELPADATLVAVGFTGLDYRNRGNLFFQCITTYLPPPLAYWTVDNLVSWSYHYFDVHSDTSWVYKPGLEYGVHLPPGRYKLKITAYTTPENPSTHPATCLLLMQPHWYNTVWFYLGGWILLASMLYRIISAREQLRKLNIALTRTKFIALQAQINPHFMGNAVNAIHRFFYPPNPGIASRYTAIFTRMLRQTLHFSETTFIPFEKEIAYCKDYLELSRLRLGNDKFKYEIRGIKSIPEDLPFPSLFLQPILENATLHGLATVGVSYVCVAFYRRNGRVICTITDNGPGFRATSEEHKEERPAYHVSKGLTLLYSKVDALNQLYDLGMQIRISDYEEDNPAGIGTRVKVTFMEAKALKATRRHRWYKLSVLI